MKKVCYTAIIGKYDYLKTPLVVSRDWDYICFTDRSDLQSNTWKIVKIDNPLSLENTRLARQIKILGHPTLEQYDLSLWIDGNVHLKCDPDKFFTDYNFNSDIMLCWHHGRSCIYEEAIACIKLKKDDEQVINNHIQRYRNEKFPKQFGLVQTGIIARQNNNRTKEFCQKWWNELMRGSKRDQLSFNYILWKDKTINIKTINPNVFQSEYFQLFNHTPNKKRLKRRVRYIPHKQIMKNRKL